MESYLTLFEQAIVIQADLVGVKKAHQQAKTAGLIVSSEGHIASCAGNPIVVLLRLIKSFTKDGNLAALEACGPLISKLTQIPQDLEKISG